MSGSSKYTNLTLIFQQLTSVFSRDDTIQQETAPQPYTDCFTETPEPKYPDDNKYNPSQSLVDGAFWDKAIGYTATKAYNGLDYTVTDMPGDIVEVTKNHYKEMIFGKEQEEDAVEKPNLLTLNDEEIKQELYTLLSESAPYETLKDGICEIDGHLYSTSKDNGWLETRFESAPSASLSGGEAQEDYKVVEPVGGLPIVTDLACRFTSGIEGTMHQVIDNTNIPLIRSELEEVADHIKNDSYLETAQNAQGIVQQLEAGQLPDTVLVDEITNILAPVQELACQSAQETQELFPDSNNAAAITEAVCMDYGISPSPSPLPPQPKNKSHIR